MAGEMSWIKQDGTDSNGDCWSTQAAIAKAVGGTLCPFDVYQGPYILIGPDARFGEPPYEYCPKGFGVVRLWLSFEDGGEAVVYREDTDTLSEPFPSDDVDLAIDAALSLLEVPA